MTKKTVGKKPRTKSTSGTTSTDSPNPEEKGLGYKAVCAIITSCHNAGVRRLSFGDLEVEFGVSSQALDSSDPVPGVYPAEVFNEDLSEEHRRMGGVAEGGAMLMTDAQRAVVDEIEMDRLMTEDPLAYEEILINNEIKANL